MIDVRAIYCIHCKKTVARHITCQHCGESNIPDDLSICWRCGREPRESEKIIECSQCFMFKGHIGDFPCPECGWHPDDQTDTVDSSIEDNTIEAGDQTKEKSIEEKTENMTHEEASENEADITEAGLIRCPSCGELVEPGSRCNLCGEYL